MNLVTISIFAFVCFCILMVLALFWFVARDWHRDGTNLIKSSTLPPPPPPRKTDNDEPLFTRQVSDMATEKMNTTISAIIRLSEHR